MLHRLKRRPEIILGLALLGLVVTVSSQTISKSQQLVVDNIAVTGFDKYSIIDQEAVRYYTNENTNQTNPISIAELVEEYNNSIPDLTEEELQKYLVVEKIPEFNNIYYDAQTYIDNNSSEGRVMQQYSYNSSADTSTLVGQLESWGIGYNLKSNIDSMNQYDSIIQAVINKHQQTCNYPIPINLVKAMIYAESSGNPNSTGSAKGLMQIDNSISSVFIKYGMDAYGETWTEADRTNPFKNIDFGVWVLAGNLNHYNGNYLKAVQAYNYSYYSLDKLIRNYGEDWINNRIHMAELNGKSSYGDSEYIEHVFQYYH